MPQVAAATFPAWTLIACASESSRLENSAPQFGWVHINPEITGISAMSATGVFENEGAIELPTLWWGLNMRNASDLFVGEDPPINT